MYAGRTGDAFDLFEQLYDGPDGPAIIQQAAAMARRSALWAPTTG